MKPLNRLAELFFDELAADNAVKAHCSESDITCFKKSLEKFLSTGNKEDAFTVYFCFSEIFRLFGKGYDNTRKLLEMLSDHEHHSGELLSKHRDHYSHSVYVFALGLAIYACDGGYKRAFDGFYGYQNGGGALGFVYLWGMTSLFHDIGYPFQLAHEQIKNYAAEMWGKDNVINPYVSFGNCAAFTALDKETSERVKKTLDTTAALTSLDELFAYGLKLRENYDEKLVAERLRRRVEAQPAFMDHAYFSAVVLAKQLLASEDFELDNARLDVLTAILLHNSFNKYEAPGRHPIALAEHPLSYLLILCDELQNWDRLAYGKISKLDPIAWDVALEIGDGSITAEYVFDSFTVTDENNRERANKSYSEIRSGEFTAKIKTYIDAPALTLQASAVERRKTKKTNVYASDNSFINLCDFAKAIHISYLEKCREMDAEHINKSFDELSLEFKVSNIEQAKSYAYKLELVNCFYSSKALDYPVVEDFGNLKIGSENSDILEFLCREEHVRWVREKLNMGWKYGTGYDEDKRDLLKVHKCIVPYEELDEKDRKKDEIMINNIIPLLKKFGNNIKIYSYRSGRKPDLEIAGTGHRFFNGDRAQLKEKIKSVLLKYTETYHVTVRTCYAYGADQLIAECANELGLTTKAVIPARYEEYVKTVRGDCLSCGHEFTADDELNMRHLLAQTVVCKVVPDPENYYLAASGHLISHCDKLIALWDGKELPLTDGNGKPVNRGGTYDCIRMARGRGLKDGEDIHIIDCQR